MGKGLYTRSESAERTRHVKDPLATMKKKTTQDLEGGVYASEREGRGTVLTRYGRSTGRGHTLKTGRGNSGE